MQTHSKVIIVKVEPAIHEKIRRYVFKHRTTIAQFIREAIDLRLQVQEGERQRASALTDGLDNKKEQ